MGFNKKILKQLVTQLTGMFNQRFAQQNELLGFIKDKLSFIFAEDFTGFLPGEEAALRTSAREGLTATFGTARQQTRQAATIAGTRQIPSGAQLALQAGIDAAEAAQQEGAQREITILGGNRRLGSILSAAGILQGNAQLLDPLGFAQAAIGGVGTRIQAGANSWLNTLLGGALGAGGSIGAAALCWIVEELWGPQYVARTRIKLIQEAHPWFVHWYLANGVAMAAACNTNLALRWVMHLQFDPWVEAAHA